MSRQTVVDELTAELTERRRTAKGRGAAYLALAQAILGDERDELFGFSALERQRPARVQSAVAA